MPAASSERALFLDRDGVINVDHGYVHTPEKFELIDGIGEVMQHFARAGYLLIIVTNQAGIARGYYTEEEFLRFDAWMRGELNRLLAVTIARTYYAPHHPEGVVDRFRGESDLRKPNPGMLLAAARDFSLNLGRSVLLGDKESDVVAGKKAGVGLNVLYAACGAPAQTIADRVVLSVSEIIDVRPT